MNNDRRNCIWVSTHYWMLWYESCVCFDHRLLFCKQDMVPSDGRSNHCHLSLSGRNITIYTIRIKAVMLRLLLPNLSDDVFYVFDLDWVAITGAIPQYFLRCSNNLIELDGGRESIASKYIPALLPFVVDLVDIPEMIVISHPSFNNFQQERSNVLIARRQVANKIYERVFYPHTGTIRRTAVEFGQQITQSKGGV